MTNSFIQSLSSYEAEKQFSDAIANAGLTPPPKIIAGKTMRFAGRDKPSRNRSAWCLLFDDYQAGAFGDWSTDFKATWRATTKHTPSRDEIRQCIEKARAAQEKAEKARKAQYSVVASEAKHLWANLPAANPNHPYLAIKQIPPRFAKQQGNNLALPMINQRKEVINFQFISPKGQKWFMTGGKKQGAFIPVHGRIEEAKEVIICEGWATGATLSLLEPSACIVAAIDCGNLLRVAQVIRINWPTVELTIAGDDDRGKPVNAGRDAALKAARAVGAFTTFPHFPQDAPLSLSDFNDLYCWEKEAMA